MHNSPSPNDLRILCVEDSLDDFELMGLALERADPQRRYHLTRVDEEQAFVGGLHAGADVVLCDFHLPRFSPYAALRILEERHSSVPLIVVTRAIGEDAAVHVLRSGAKDYITKDKLGTLPQIIERVIDHRRKALEAARMSRELEASYERFRKLSARLVFAQERERTLISRELHDGLGQTLTGMMIHLHASRRSTDAQTAIGHADTALQMAQEAITIVRTMSFSLRPAQLDLLGLVAAATSAVQRIAEPAGLAFTVTSRGVEPAKPGTAASVAMRLIQEALTNVVRHARATRVVVRLRFLPNDRIGILVADNGVGFDKHEVLQGFPSERNVGLYGMIERTELAGGHLNIRARRGVGVALRAVL